MHQNQPPYSPHAQQAPSPYAQPPYNPYAAPSPAMYRQNVFVPYGAAAGPLVSPTLRKMKLGIGIVQTVAIVAAIAFFITGASMGKEGNVFVAVGVGLFALGYLSLFAYAIVNVMWTYKFWSWIPPEQRHTSMWKKYISPGTAIGFMFIPYFNIYWMFVVYLGLAEIMERLRVQFPCSKGPAKTLAILAIAVPIVFFPAGPFLQYAFAKRLEAMANEMQRRMAGGAYPSP